MDKELLSELIDGLFNDSTIDDLQEEFIDYVKTLIDNIKQDKELNAINKLKLIVTLKHALDCDADAWKNTKEKMKNWRS